ncbi:carbohydrate binding domain-containing protein [Anaerobacillus sp. CMMVII]|uniref:carbohydrate binding domain-containing protein n=1 Tax=Anaerobacillus sp. CMMVII TaxID=2755588 RepID=UPI0021B713AB|nr:carbohydrate binding domain-containing protein [Anaerobacillus sp. CMMVII]MCT8137048.1 carbohydrate binding domain-containing protein [Anaerobacillus sp. CMMVII]
MLKKSINMFLVFLLILSNFSMVVGANEMDEAQDDWTLVWSDEFEGDELDGTKWTRDLGNGFFQADGTFIPGWGNEELQSYQDDNVRVENGKLILEGRKETVTDRTGTYNYTSGKVHTQGKFSQKYGRFEASIKLPEGQGYWPAFWMMPEEDVYGGWAASGEIDIMENAGSHLNKIGGAIHYGGQWPNNTYTAKDYYFPDGKDITDFNLYAVEWEPGEIRWYVNDVLYQTVNNWSSTSNGNPAKFSYPAPFDQEFYIILNLAIGGWYGGNPNDTTPFPGEMLVDYVRVYELTGRDYREPVEPVFAPVELPADAKVAVDGNYVYDTNYEKGFTVLRSGEEEWNNTYWNFLNLNEFNGTGSVSVDTLNGDKFAKVDIANGGNQTYSIQLIQNVTMGTGRWYKLSFDAKSNTNRNINVKIGGGADRGWTAYSPNMDYSLTNEVQSYEMVFQMQHDTDPRARLEFNLGINSNPVWIGNVVVEEVDALDPYNEDAAKRPLRDGNHVYNGTFDQGRMDRMTYWNFDTEGAIAKASVDPDTRKLAVAITDGGTSVDSIKLVQKGMNLLPTDEYKLTFDAKAGAARNIEVALLSKDGSVNYSGNQVISLTTNMGTKEATLVMPNVQDIEGQLVFFLGGNASDIVIDNLKMVRTTNNNASVTVEQAFPLKNGDFSSGLKHWDQHIHGVYEPSSEATFDVVDSTFKANIINTGWEPWHVLLMQNGMKLLRNQTYVVEFDAKSTVDRNIEVVLENASYQRYFAEKVELTNALQTYKYEFVMSNDETVDLKFLLGKIVGSDDIGNHEVVIDNVKLEVKGERERYFPLTNGDFINGIEGWHNHVQGVWEGQSRASFGEEDGKAKITVDHTGNDTWHVQFFQDNITLEEGLTYVIQFDGSASINRNIELIVENASYHRYFSEEISLTTQTETYKYEFDMNSTDVTALKFLLGSVGGVIADSHDIFIDNVRLEVKGAREVLNGSQDDEEPTEPANPDDKVWKEVGDNLIIDGTFDTTTEFGNPGSTLPWNVHNQGVHEEWAGLADFSVVDGVLHAEIKQVGWDWWHIQLLQAVTVPSGTYKIAFDMQSDHERPVNVELVGSGTGIQKFNVDATMETHEVIIEVTETGNYSLMFGLGREGADPELSTPYTILIDNVRLVEVEEVEGTEPGEEPGDGQPGEEPGDGQPGEEPGDGQPGEEPGDGQPGEEPGDGQPGEEPGDGQPGEEPGDGQPGEEPGDGQPGEEPGDGQPGEEPGDGQPGEKPRDDKKGEKSKDDQPGKDPKTKKDTDKKLPNTATNSFNLLLVGLTLIILSGIALFVKRRRNLA